jgi:hypothetical protein
MKRMILSCMLILLIAGCKKGSEMIDNSEAGPPPVDFSLFDSNGVDLLNPANENALQEKDIKLYCEENGEWIYLFTPLTAGGGPADNPRGFMIYDDYFLYPELFPESRGEYRLRTGAYYDGVSLVTRKKIEWGSPEYYDILTCEWRYGGPGKASTVINKLYLNDELRYEYPIDEVILFEIVRDFPRWHE